MNKQNKPEAKRIIKSITNQYEALSYEDLRKLLEENTIETKVVTGESGTRYQVELKAMWDDKPGGDIRFSGSIYDDSASRFLNIKTPVTYDFLKTTEY